jgi:hypothetical protein
MSEYLDYNASGPDTMQEWHKRFDGNQFPEEYEQLLIRPISMHPGDCYLAIVMCHLPKNNLHPYATWLCNSAFEKPFYAEGHYFQEKWDAFEDWKTRK